MNRAEKAAVIEQIKGRMDKAAVALVTDFQGAKVEEMTSLRIKLRGSGMDYQVVKNTLARIALEGGPHDVLRDQLKESCGVALGYDDPVAAAKVLVECCKGSKKFKVRFGSLQGRLLNAAAVEQLATLPGKPELLARALGTMNAVPTNFVCLFANLLRNFLYALNAVKEQKESA